jgi:WD40 repeat protein
MSIDCLYRERAVSCGRDRTVRLWKVRCACAGCRVCGTHTHSPPCRHPLVSCQIPEDSHLVLRGPSASLSAECVRVVAESWFVCGSQDGSLGLYHLSRKKPVVVVPRAHGDGPTPLAGASWSAGLAAVTAAHFRWLHVVVLAADPWVSSLAVLPNTDLVASGAGDGVVKLWRVTPQNRGGSGDDESAVGLVASVPVVGAVPRPARVWQCLTHPSSPLTACVSLRGWMCLAGSAEGVRERPRVCAVGSVPGCCRGPGAPSGSVVVPQGSQERPRACQAAARYAQGCCSEK